MLNLRDILIHVKNILGKNFISQNKSGELFTKIKFLTGIRNFVLQSSTGEETNTCRQTCFCHESASTKWIMKLTVFNLRHSCDQVTAGTGSRSRTGPVLERSGSSSSIRRRSARGRSSSRPSPSTAAPSPRSCCQRNTWSQVRRWPHDVTTPVSWCHHADLMMSHVPQSVL